jgi:hypothetical protein
MGDLITSRTANAPKLTADTITDDQIRELFYADEIAAIDLTVATLPGWSAEDRRETRARCAELFYERARARCPGRQHDHHLGDVCEGTCCTACGGPIDENEECRC